MVAQSKSQTQPYVSVWLENDPDHTRPFWPLLDMPVEGMYMGGIYEWWYFENKILEELMREVGKIFGFGYIYNYLLTKVWKWKTYTKLSIL